MLTGQYSLNVSHIDLVSDGFSFNCILQLTSLTLRLALFINQGNGFI